jgi:peptidoglycan/xylan/chitin deacetylase (PgdA/CDA1 family)
VVPAWLTGRRWRHLKDLGAKESSLWCWHQHGWRHANHEIDGKKQEFGASRDQSDIKRDLLLGKRRLEDFMGANFYPVFTPPWNRCSFSTLELLRELGFAAVSRSCDGRPETPEELPDFCVNVDLHTRKERNPVVGWNNLFDGLQQAIALESCGIMIHHQRMNAAAFDFLDILLRALLRHKKLQLIHFKHLKSL